MHAWFGYVIIDWTISVGICDPNSRIYRIYSVFGETVDSRVHIWHVQEIFSLWWRNLLIWNIKLVVVYRAVNLDGCKCFLVNTCKEFPKNIFFRMWLCEVVSSNSDKVSLYGRKIWIWLQDVQACDFCFPGTVIYWTVNTKWYKRADK